MNNNNNNNNKTKVDIYKEGRQTGKLDEKEIMDILETADIYFDNVCFEQKYVDVENEHGIITKELSEIEMCGKFEIRLKNTNNEEDEDDDYEEEEEDYDYR